MTLSTHNLSFDEINKETINFDKDICKIKSFSGSERQIYLTDRLKQLEQCLTQILELEELQLKKAENGVGSIRDWDPYYTLIGHFFEGFIKTILMIEDFDNFFLNYNNENKPLKRFEDAKQELNRVLKIKNLDEEQAERMKEVLDYIQLQRNNFIHFPLKTYRIIGVKFEIYMVIKKLCEQNQIIFSEETINKLNNAIGRESYYRVAMKFKDVWEH